MRWAIVALAAASVLITHFEASAQMPEPNDIDVVIGNCQPTSHVAEGPIGTDLTKRQSRFFCNSASITFFPNYKGHVMVQFAQKESNHGPMLGFSGKMDADGIIMDVERVYLTQGTPMPVSDGVCKFFFKNKHISGIFCGAKVDESGRRTSAVLAFDPAPGQWY